MISLDLGSGPNPRNPYSMDEVWGIDINPAPNVKAVDLTIEPIPWGDSSIDAVTARDFLEHIPRLLYIDGERRSPFIELMNEIWRVLVPGGRLYTETPAWPHHESFVDPTHVNHITEGTMFYFTEHEITKAYGFKGKFNGTQFWSKEIPYWLVWDLVAVK